MNLAAQLRQVYFSCRRAVKIEDPCKISRELEIGPDFRQHADTSTYSCLNCNFECKKPQNFASHLCSALDQSQQKTEIFYKCDFIGCNIASKMSSCLYEHRDTAHISLNDRTCQVCDLPFKSLELLLEHKIAHDPSLSGSFKCSHCDLKYGSIFLLRKHVLTHTQVRVYPCRSCDMTFSTWQDFNEHLKKHQDHSKTSDFHKCDSCKFFTDTLESLNAHKATHLREFPCDSCDRVYLSARALKSHQKIHECMFLCTTCGKECKSIYNLKEHEETHLRGTDYVCTIKGCNYAGKSWTLLRKHKSRMHHAKIKTCEICGKSMKAMCMFAHRKTHDANRTRPHECPVCGKTFESSSVMRSHVAQRHEDARNFECDVCKKRYNYKWLVRAHIGVVHLRLKKQMCDICGKKLSTLDAFKAHRATHTGETPYGCKLCPAKFGHRSALAKHNRSHFNLM